jgi:hypothetical protein
VRNPIAEISSSKQAARFSAKENEKVRNKPQLVVGAGIHEPDVYI